MSRELLRAIVRNQFGALNDLIAQGQDILARTESENWTFLHLAFMVVSRHPSPEMVAELINRGLDVNAIDSYGNSPLHYAASMKLGPGVSEVLLRAGADVNHLNNEGITPLREMIGKPTDHVSIRLALQFGADLDFSPAGGISTREFVMIIAHDDDELMSLFVKAS